MVYSSRSVINKLYVDDNGDMDNSKICSLSDGSRVGKERRQKQVKKKEKRKKSKDLMVMSILKIQRKPDLEGCPQHLLCFQQQVSPYNLSCFERSDLPVE